MHARSDTFTTPKQTNYTSLSIIQTNNRPLPQLRHSSRLYEKCTCHSYTKKNNSHDKFDLSNYRPISNLSYISKTLERIVSSQLHVYLDNNNILNQFQSAYTIYKSTETALKHILCNILLHPTKLCSIIIFLDLSAAFDTIDHSLLIRRLAEHRNYRHCTRLVHILPRQSYILSMHRLL